MRSEIVTCLFFIMSQISVSWISKKKKMPHVFWFSPCNYLKLQKSTGCVMKTHLMLLECERCFLFCNTLWLLRLVLVGIRTSALQLRIYKIWISKMMASCVSNNECSWKDSDLLWNQQQFREWLFHYLIIQKTSFK